MTGEEGELYRSITAGGSDSHVTQVLYGTGVPLVNSAGVPCAAAYIETLGDPSCDLRSNIAAEARVNHLRTPDQPHRRSGCGGGPRALDDARKPPPEVLRKGLAIDDAQFSARQAAGRSPFRLHPLQLSASDGDMRGPWNEGEQWTFVDHEEAGAELGELPPEEK